MNRRELLKTGVAGVLPVVLRRPVPAHEVKDGIVVLTNPTGIIEASEWGIVGERLSNTDRPATIRITVPTERGQMEYEAHGFVSAYDMCIRRRERLPGEWSVVPPFDDTEINLTFRPISQRLK